MDGTQKATFVASALRMLKERLDRLPDDTSRDEYFTARIEQTIEELEQKGITLTDSVADLMLVVDGAAWNHANRDKMTGEPEWLRRKILNRWINDGNETVGESTKTFDEQIALFQGELDDDP